MDERTIFSELDTQIQERLMAVHLEPIRDPRHGTPGEVIYLQLWKNYIEQDRGRLHEIVRHTHTQVDQRHASVCASFMVWMGTNCGHDFTHQTECVAKALEQTRGSHGFAGREHAFLMTWGTMNARNIGSNSNVRLVEAMLHPSYHMVKQGHLGMRVDWETLDKITLRDYETVQAMVRWWSTPDAQEMREEAKPLIEAGNETARRQGWSWPVGILQSIKHP